MSLRSSLVHDGWTPGGDELPPNWFSRVSSTHIYLFISSDGELLQSKGLAIKHLMRSSDSSSYNKSLIENYRRPDITSLRPQQRHGVVGVSNMKPMKREPVRILNPDDSWLPGDETLPKGWKFKEIKVGNNKPYNMLLSARGYKFRSIRMALSFLISNNSPEVEIEEVRACLVHEGWVSDPLLPKIWFYKNVKSKQHKQPMYCNEVGDLLVTHIAAAEYLKNSESYNSDDTNNFIMRIEKTRI